jgi:uncharacterized phage protein (TIGR01671 family)
MGREIKFRAWDEKRNRMFIPYSGNFGVKMAQKNFFVGINGTGLEVSEYEGKGYWRVLPIMQYSGLKDKNGKEIYEGDIVSATNRLHECEVKQNVHYLNGCFMFGNWNAHEFFNKHQFIEVIGNIYENPELLEGNQDE